MGFKDTLLRNLKTTGVTIKKHSPEILVAVGCVAAVGATVMACKATLDVQEPLKESQDKIKALKENKEQNLINEDDYKKEITHEYVEIGKTVAKHYALPAALEVAALGTIFASNNIQRKRNASLTASLTAVDAIYQEYRKRVIEKYGEEEDFYLRTGTKKIKVTDEEIDEESGKTKKVKRDAIAAEVGSCGEFSIIFSPKTHRGFHKSHGVNEDFLNARINAIYKLLPGESCLTINDMLTRYFDFDRENTKAAGQIYGFYFDPNDREHNSAQRIRYYDVIDDDGNTAFLIDFEGAELLTDKAWTQGNENVLDRIRSRYHLIGESN